jgi:enoyl-CoA hydratase/carnithine racemase
MTQSSTVVLERLSPHIASVAFSNPPANLIVPDAVSRLHDIVVALSNEPDIKVALFSSNLPEFFINHFDLG